MFQLTVYPQLILSLSVPSNGPKYNETDRQGAARFGSALMRFLAHATESGHP